MTYFRTSATFWMIWVEIYGRLASCLENFGEQRPSNLSRHCIVGPLPVHFENGSGHTHTSYLSQTLSVEQKLSCGAIMLHIWQFRLSMACGPKLAPHDNQFVMWRNLSLLLCQNSSTWQIYNVCCLFVIFCFFDAISCCWFMIWLINCWSMSVVHPHPEYWIFSCF